MSHPSDEVRCQVYLREGYGDGYLYTNMTPEGAYPTGGFGMRAVHPPAVGDLLSLPMGLMGRVIDRCWTPVMRGSAAWPAHESRPLHGPLLTLIVVKDEGPFLDEVTRENPRLPQHEDDDGDGK